jgi:choline dehydrogenase-like flavoprotein
MTVSDFRTAPPGTVFEADLALVGGGPMALAIAREFAGTKCRILVLESGGATFERQLQELNAVENIGEPRERPGVAAEGRGYSGELEWLNSVAPFELRNRLIGGSTHTWVGKCAAFDEIDFRKRSWIPNSGWPIARHELDGALDRAGAILDLGPNLYDARLYGKLASPPRGPALDGALLRPFFWQFSHQGGGEPMRLGKAAEALTAANIEILTHATVTQIQLDDSCRRVGKLEIRSFEGHRAYVRAATVVLCAGGVENARLLLASNRQIMQGVGNRRGNVGRYLSDHPRAAIARFTGSAIGPVAKRFGFYGAVGEDRTRFYLHGVALSPEAQERHGMVNCAAYPVQQLSTDDPFAALRRMLRGPRENLLGDVLSVCRSAGPVAQGAWHRLVRKRGLPRKATELRFDVMCEQVPDPDSRITLSPRKSDRFGTPLPRIDWRIGETERESVKHLARFMAREFTRIGLPAPQLASWITDDDNSMAAFRDMAHPSGTTRMGDDPATSVIDANCKIHDVDGLYVAGTSIFPTGGHANPTLMAMAMAIRLADHLKTQMAVPASTPRRDAVAA